jgi:hypothetical protein
LITYLLITEIVYLRIVTYLREICALWIKYEFSLQLWGKISDDRKIYDNCSMYLGLFYVIFSSFNKLQEQNHVKSIRKLKGHKLDISWRKKEEKIQKKKVKNEDSKQITSYHDAKGEKIRAIFILNWLTMRILHSIYEKCHKLPLLDLNQYFNHSTFFMGIISWPTYP